jgi:hypothetical protein
MAKKSNNRFLDLPCLAGCGRILRIDLGPKGRTPKTAEQLCLDQECIRQRAIRAAASRGLSYGPREVSEQVARYGKPKQDVETGDGPQTITTQREEDQITDVEQSGTITVGTNTIERRRVPNYLKSVAQPAIFNPAKPVLDVTNTEGDLIKTVPLVHSIAAPPHRGPRFKRVERAKPIPCPHGQKRNCRVCKIGKYAVPERLGPRRPDLPRPELRNPAPDPSIYPPPLPPNFDGLSPELKKEYLEKQRAEVEQAVRERNPEEKQPEIILSARTTLGLSKEQILSWLEIEVIRKGGHPKTEVRTIYKDRFDWVRTLLATSPENPPVKNPGEIVPFDEQIRNIKRVRKEFSKRNPAYAHLSQTEINKVKRSYTAEIKNLEKLLAEEAKSKRVKKPVSTAPIPLTALPDDDAKLAAGYVKKWIPGPAEQHITIKIPSADLYIPDTDIASYKNGRQDQRTQILFENEAIRRAYQTGEFQPALGKLQSYRDKHSTANDGFPSIISEYVIDYVHGSRKRQNIADFYVDEDQNPDEDLEQNVAMILKTQGESIGASIKGPGWRTRGSGDNVRLVPRQLESFDDLGRGGNTGGKGAGSDSDGSWLADLDSGDVGEDE